MHRKQCNNLEGMLNDAKNILCPNVEWNTLWHSCQDGKGSLKCFLTVNIFSIVPELIIVLGTWSKLTAIEHWELTYVLHILEKSLIYKL